MAEELKKSLGFYSIFALIITSMLGTSLFFGISTGARLAGAASIISWVVLGLVAIYISACFSELISMYPTSGGVYEFAKQAYGRFPSFLVGWIAWIVANVGAAVLVVAAMDFIIPSAGAMIFAGIAIDYSAVKLICAIIIILAFNYVTYRGAQASGVTLMLFSLVIIGVLIAIIIPGFSLFDTSHFSNMHATPIMLFAAIFFIAESFFGWESASFLAEETEDAARTIPKALIAATTVVVLLGVGLVVVLFGAYNAEYLAASSSPVQSLVQTIFPPAMPFVLWGIFLMFLGGVISSVVSSPRLLFALARDKLFIEQCTKIHPKYGTPVNAIIFQTVITIVAVVVAFGRYQFLLSILVPLALLMYAIVIFTLPVLRRKQPTIPRPFKVWAGYVGPTIVALFFCAVIVAWAFTSENPLPVIALIAGFMLLSIPIFMFLTMIYNPDVIISVNNGAARFNYVLENILLPKRVRKDIIDLFKDHLKGKTVIEFGAGVGTFTMHLAEEVGASGSVTAIDLSRTNLDIIEARAKEKGHKHVHVLHDEHQINRLHPDIRRADLIYSIGFLGYVQDLKKVLKEMHSVLVPGGKICFVEYTNFFKFFPDPPVVSNMEKLLATFRDAGFAVSIHKRKGILWNYLVIYGIKADRQISYI